MIQKMQFDIEIKILDLLDNIEKNKRNGRFFYELETIALSLPRVSKTGFVGLPWWLSGKESACQCRRHRFDP